MRSGYDVKIHKLSEREKGRNLVDLGLGHITPVTAYRAVKHDVQTIKNMDYVTLSYSFAKGHANHMAATEEEDYIVLSFKSKPESIVEAGNPGEYFYDGEEVFGKQIYLAKAT
jgi:hypothetical protein